MIPEGYRHLPLSAEEHGAFKVWDLREWEGDVDTLDAINEAWVEAHSPDEKVGTVSVFPEDVILDDGVQDFLTEGWNEAAEMTGLRYLAIVAPGIKKLTVKSQIHAPVLEEMETFDEVDPAVEWMQAQVA
jgi:hypothetical protein